VAAKIDHCIFIEPLRRLAARINAHRSGAIQTIIEMPGVFDCPRLAIAPKG
jgi:hypothetical protein